MNTGMIVTLSILGLSAALFVSGKVRSDLVAVCALIALVLLGILSPAEALSGFSNSVVIMMIGLFVVGGGIFHTGLANIVSGKLLKLAGRSETRLLATVMLAGSLIGAFVSNTGTVAVMLPIVVSLAMRAEVSPGKLLMPLAFASSLGGTLTLIGTPPNMVIRETLMNGGFGELQFFSFTPIGLVCLAIGTVLTVVLSKWLLKGKERSAGKDEGGRSLEELAKQYRLSDDLYRLQAAAGSPAVSRTLRELPIASQFDLHIREIRRQSAGANPFFKTINMEVAGPDTTVLAGDILYVKGRYEDAERFAREYGLKLLDSQAEEKGGEVPEQGGYANLETGIAELLIPPNSRHINQLVKHSGFREQYNVNILGIQRRGEVVLHRLQDEKIRSGDALLVQGAWSSLESLAQEHSDIVVVGRPKEEAAAMPLSHKAPIAAAIMVLMVASLIAELFPAVVTVMIAAVLMVATGCLRNMEAAYKTVNWESIVLIGGMIPMSAAIEKTGAAALASEQLVGSLGSFGPLAMLAGIYFATSLLTLFISNTACAVLFAPIALAAAVQLGVNPVPFLFAVALGASICFAVPFSTPPNALVMSAGRYSFMDYIKVGMPVQLALGVAMVLLLPLFFPF